MGPASMSDKDTRLIKRSTEREKKAEMNRKETSTLRYSDNQCMPLPMLLLDKGTVYLERFYYRVPFDNPLRNQD